MLPEPSRQNQFEGIILSFMRDQRQELRKLKEYMNEIDKKFMHLSLMVIEMAEEKIRARESEKIQKITKFPGTMESESLNTFRSFNTKTLSPHSSSSLPNQQSVRYVYTISPSPPLVRKSTFGFKHGTKNNQNSLETDTQETDKNQAKNNKTKHKVEKIEEDEVNRSRKSKVKARGQQKSTLKSQSQPQESQ
nr:hypothetical protein [Tanacetum cinerariifolium]